MEEVRQIQRCRVVGGLECHDRDFVVDPELGREPVKLLQNGSDVVDVGDNTTCAFSHGIYKLR